MGNNLNKFRAFGWRPPEPSTDPLLIGLGKFFINTGLQLADLIRNVETGVPQIAQFFYLALKGRNWLFKIESGAFSPSIFKVCIIRTIIKLKFFIFFLQMSPYNKLLRRSGSVCVNLCGEYPQPIMSASCANLPRYLAYVWQMNVRHMWTYTIRAQACIPAYVSVKH